MTKELSLTDAMAVLSRRRRIFHSEADFQHELAWTLREMDPCLQIRLEHPRHDRTGAVDLVARRDGRPVLALELKYLTRQLSINWEGEAYELKAQSGAPIRRHGVIKDLAANERFIANYPDARAAVIVLTNDPGYWQDSSREGVSDAAFRIHDGRAFSGALGWSANASLGLTRGKVSPFELIHQYVARWRDFSVVDAGPGRGTFRFLCLEAPVGNGANALRASLPSGAASDEP